MISLTVLNTLTVLSTPYGTAHTLYRVFIYCWSSHLLPVRRKNTLIWSSKNIVCPLCSNKTISPDVRQKPSCLWCGKKLSCLWYGKNLLACGAAKALLPVVWQKLSCLWCGLRHEPPLSEMPNTENLTPFSKTAICF